MIGNNLANVTGATAQNNVLIKTCLFMSSSLPILLEQETLYVSCNGLVGCAVRTFGAEKGISDPSSNSVLVVWVHYRTPAIGKWHESLSLFYKI